METTPDRTFVNAPIDQELLEKLDIMVKAKESTRAQFIRLLVRQEWENKREAEGYDLLLKKALNGKKQIKQLRAEA